MPINTNVKPSDQAVLAATIDPDVLTAANHDSDYVDMSNFDAALAIVSMGTLGSSATVDADILEATSSGGAGAQVLKSITQLTQAGSDDDKQVAINVWSHELSEGFTHIALRITVGTASCDGAGFILGFGARYQPAADLASVDEVVG